MIMKLLSRYKTFYQPHNHFSCKTEYRGGGRYRSATYREPDDHRNLIISFDPIFQSRTKNIYIYIYNDIEERSFSFPSDNRVGSWNRDPWVPGRFGDEETKKKARAKREHGKKRIDRTIADTERYVEKERKRQTKRGCITIRA